MTKTASKRIPGLPAFKERLLDNGAIERTVKIRAGEYRGHALRFTKHSEDRYTVFGLEHHPRCGLLIERRTKHVTIVVLAGGYGQRYRLQPEHLWIATKYDCGGLYGVKGVGSTPEEAYRNSFDRDENGEWRKGWPA